MDEKTIEFKIEQIINSYFDDESIEKFSISDQLHIILSESSQALSLITSFEDEFQIEFDDDDIDLEFFLNFEIIKEKITWYLSHSK